ncbi:MAG: type II toxin-antitoxin system VapC family toxin [Saprospiraceae bacterium]
MNYLIDTHVLIWFGETSPQLPERIRVLIEDTSNNIFVSTAAIWEMAIKMALKKLEVTYTLSQWEYMLLRNQFSLLHADFRHFETLQTLPFHHQDPFDRLMISQAIIADLTIITHDKQYKLYPVKLEFF